MSKKLINVAKILRRNMTKQEKHLWYDFLKNYPVKIYKQRVLDNFIVDFYCHQARLAIEIDGLQHYTAIGSYHDAVRTEILEKYNIVVLRFSNEKIDKEFDEVCFVIDRIIKERLGKIL